jgi:hypothetical protein
MASVDLQWPESQAPEDALSQFRVSESAAIEKQRYKVTDQSQRSVTYKRRYLSPLGFVIGLLIFPVGILVWIFYRQDESFTVVALADNGGSMISIQGEMRPKLRSAFGELAQMRNAEVEARAQDPGDVDERVEDTETLDDDELEPPSANGDESPLVREVRDAGLIAEGMRRRVEADSNGGEIDCSEMEDELERIYALAGAPSAFPEALDKVEALADDLTKQADCRYDEALYVAFRRSLAEHHEYLSAQGVSDPASS